MASEDLK